jgi:iron complex transport system ATP-binding protein
MPDVPPLLEMDRVSVLREGRRALDRLTLTIAVGENVAVLGPNGSGKSSLLKLVTRELYPHPSSGAFRILGRDRWDVAKLRGTLGIVSNDLQANLPGAATAREAVVAGFTGRLGVFYDDSTEERIRLAEAALGQADAGHLTHRRLETLSSGEARRVLLARALAHDPAALILDEPSTSLDIASAHALMQTVRGLVRSGKGLVLVTHHLEEIVPEISRVVLLREGKVLADGPREEVMTAANLTATFGVPIVLEGDGPYRAHVRP